ncbi:MAG: DUF2834 domain-containing protein [Desulfosarcinaceae bacterium]|nr:DUF2834 domain-containing protein [Desulfosarcinaceae bacterium]
MARDKRFYRICGLIGAIVPWCFAAPFLVRTGFNPTVLRQSLFANGAAAGFTADPLISALVFWV